jgi:hypothetical protein
MSHSRSIVRFFPSEEVAIVPRDCAARLRRADKVRARYPWMQKRSSVRVFTAKNGSLMTLMRSNQVPLD